MVWFWRATLYEILDADEQWTNSRMAESFSPTGEHGFDERFVAEPMERPAHTR